MNSCNYTKHLANNETLLGENRLILKTNTPLKYKGEFTDGILMYARPQPNSHLLDLSILPKFKLWKYNNQYAKYKKDSLNDKIIKHKVEPPSLVDSNMVKKSELNMKQFMLNQGYFYAQVESKILDTKNPKIKDVEYKIDAGKNYSIGKVDYNINNGNMKFLISKYNHESVIKTNSPFTNFSCGLERERIYKIMRDNGYYDFKMDNISFIIDTTDKQSLLNLSDDIFEQSFNFKKEKTENKFVNITMKISQSKDSSFDVIYEFKDIFVEINDGFIKKNEGNMINTTYDHIHFSYITLPINQKVIARNIFIEEGKNFNTTDVEATMNRLNQLGVFQFVNVRYEKIPDEPGKLNTYITLNTSPKMDATLLSDISTSDGDYFVGFGGSAIYKNRNLFRGANQMEIRGAYSTEFRNDALLNGKKHFYLSGNNASLKTEFTFPKFIVPFSQRFFNKKTIPFTIFSVNYTFIQRIQSYHITNATGTFGYGWRETKKKNWRLNPAFLTISKVPEDKLSDDFKNKISNNQYLKNIFTDNTIYGENVSFEYKSNPDNPLKNNTFLNIRFEEAGTILRGVDFLYHQASGKYIYPIAQYIKIESDARRYLKNPKSEWVNRIMFGVGIPLGRSVALPYIKSYSAGGSFSNRGFRPRSLGPGRSIDNSPKAAFIDRTGDLKIEMNTEYRMNLLKLLSGVINIKGALFADAGNVWLFHKNKDVVGGEFEPNYFLQDIAISTGAGLRLDFSFFVFRVDLGFPIKQPNLTDNYGFAFDKLKYRSGIWNIAFGYPF